MLKATKSKKLTAEENEYNRGISKFRYVVEETFLIFCFMQKSQIISNKKELKRQIAEF